MRPGGCKLVTVPFLTDAQVSFTHYVQGRKRTAAARAREGAAYAYGGEQRTRLRLGRLRPVVLSLELGLAEFAKSGRALLLQGAIEVGPTRFPLVAKATADAAAALGLPVPRTFVSPSIDIREASVFGDADEPLLVLPAVFVDHLSAPELQSTLGSDMGRVHNGHAPLLTALWVLQTAAPTALRWVAKPATLLLTSWARGADITADRAGLLVSRNFASTAGALAKRLGGGRRLLADIQAEGALQHLDSPEPHADVGLQAEQWNQWRLRVKALDLFRRTAFYQGGAGDSAGAPGLTLAECNDQVATLLGAP